MACRYQILYFPDQTFDRENSYRSHIWPSHGEQRHYGNVCPGYPKDYPEPESVVAVLRRGKKVKELPVVMRERNGGVSSISLKKIGILYDKSVIGDSDRKDASTKGEEKVNVRLQIIVAIAILFALGIIINMIRKRALELRYALAWLIVGVGVLILDVFPGVMEKLASVFRDIFSSQHVVFSWFLLFVGHHFCVDGCGVENVYTD